MATRLAGRKKGGDITPADNGRIGPLTEKGGIDQARNEIKGLGQGAYDFYEKLVSTYRDSEQRRLSEWLQLGREFETIETNWKLEGLKTFCKYMGIDPKDARMAIRASQKWTTDDITAILRRTRAQGGHITWAHVRIILGQSDEEREHYLGVIEHEKMSQRALIARIKADKAPAEAQLKKGGRTYNIPTAVGEFYENHVQQTGRFRNYIGAVDAALPKVIEGTTEDTFNETLLGRAQTMRGTWEEVAQRAQEMAERLRGFELAIERKLGLQPPADTAAASDAAEDEVEVAAPARRMPLAVKNRIKEQ
jgi:hypothetical protein